MMLINRSLAFIRIMIWFHHKPGSSWDPQNIVHDALGKPLKTIRKGLTLYQLQETGEHETYQLDKSYVTIFMTSMKMIR